MTAQSDQEAKGDRLNTVGAAIGHYSLWLVSRVGVKGLASSWS